MIKLHLKSHIRTELLHSKVLLLLWRHVLREQIAAVWEESCCEQTKPRHSNVITNRADILTLVNTRLFAGQGEGEWFWQGIGLP